MFNTLYLLTYNNYYNRIVKSEPNLNLYLESLNSVHADHNFNPSDGINTEVILNVPDWDNSDYMVVINDLNEIVSRWFVIERTRIRGNQFKLILRRDIIVDYYNIIMNSPSFINKGYVDTSNPLIYNSENVTFNQIKKGEYLLSNELNTPWLVAYLSRWHTETVDGQEVQKYNSFTGEFTEETDLTPDYTLNSLEDYIFYKYCGDTTKAYIYTTDVSFCMNYHSREELNLKDAATAENRIYGLSKSGYIYRNAGWGTYPSLPIYENGNFPVFDDEAERLAAYNELYTKYLTYSIIDPITGLPINSYTNVGTFDGYKELTRESNKIIKVDTGDSTKYYRIVANASSPQYINPSTITLKNQTGTFGNEIYQKLVSTGGWTVPSNALIDPFIQIPVKNSGIFFKLVEISSGKKIQYNFSYTSNITTQTPYEIVAAPLNDTLFSIGGLSVNHRGEVALNWFLDMAQKGHAAGLVYDIQIVPYCPIYSTDISQFKYASCYYENESGNPLAVLIKVPTASFTRTYSAPLDLPIDLDYKTSINCDLYRLCSPNGMGTFEFSVAKNNGLNGFEVDCTLMPFNPYIKINPIFNTSGLYGGDYNDFRGLICKGDFSLPITSDQWSTYELQNKNYQAIFDRETQTLDKQNTWAMAEAKVQAIFGSLGGAASGAIIGSMLPGIGTAIGGISGALLSGGAGAADIAKTYSLQKEQMSARQDIFDLNLQTIQARPNTLTRTTAFNINNKYFPYIEYYSCTDEEKVIFKDKIKYEGMTINAIGLISNYIGPEQTFIQATPLRLYINEDYHVANEIVKELKQGIYIGGNEEWASNNL